MNPRHTPFLRLFLPWVTGILAGAALEYPVPGLGWALLAGSLVLPVIVHRRYAYRFRWVFGTVLTLTLIIAGYLHVLEHDERRREDHFSHLHPEAEFYCGTVYGIPSKGAKLKVPIRLEAAGASPNKLLTCSGNVLLFLDTTMELRYGDRIWVTASVRPVQPPNNPHAFDYRRYLHFQNIHYQSFVKPDAFGLLATGQGNPVWQAAFGWRDRLLGMLRAHFPGRDERAVASALLLGYREELSDELRTSYAETGSMHILAVSGTHVGLLYVGLLLVLNRIPWRGRARRWGETLLVLGGIWTFALVTGATASVLRASVMFTTYILGKAIRRQASIWNILGASAFALLFFNPYLLFEVGFQLSYAAVAGIVFFYPKFQKITPPLPIWATEGWKILLIGVAAQLGTLPLSLYYFHQFPVFFWLAGWVVVLGGAMFLWGGFIMVLIYALMPVVAGWLGWCLYHLLWGMNQLIRVIQQLPGSVWSGIWIEAWAAVVLMLFIWTFGEALPNRKPRLLLVSLTLLALLGLNHTFQKIRQIRQKQLTLYHTQRNFLLDFFASEQQLSLADSIDSRREQFAAQLNRWANGIRHAGRIPDDFQTADLYFNKPFLQFFQKKLLVLDRSVRPEPHAGSRVPVDVLIVHGNPNVDPDDCLEKFPCRLVVFSAGNSRRRIEQWKEHCRKRGLEYYDVGESGAWQFEIR